MEPEYSLPYSQGPNTVPSPRPCVACRNMLVFKAKGYYPLPSTQPEELPLVDCS
jgi:hypothetical protein